MILTEQYNTELPFNPTDSSVRHIARIKLPEIPSPATNKIAFDTENLKNNFSIK